MKLLFLLCSIIPTIINGSTGGNCENVCNYQIDNYWTPCIEANCPQMGHTLCPTKNATTCVCSKNCQMCVDDLFNECGGCTNKKGYDFDKDVEPEYKKIAENMGCNRGSVTLPMINLLIICLLINIINFL
tara:strand:- start:1031 stop:1420 length:390 start_codon:yes stop_codon:yes gene_type:complete